MVRPFACDMVLVENGKILLIRRGREPAKGLWALPGGRIEEQETAEQCAMREMREETGLEIGVIRLLGVYSDPERDPRGIIAASYLVRRVGGNIRPGDDSSEVRWFDLSNLPGLAFDHKKIIEDALKGN